jgi:hypothetical protein
VTFLRVIDFEKLQHYRDRKPPWIKLYRDLWSDPRFFDLNETERYFLISFYIVASQTDNRIPENPAWLKKEMATTKPIPIARLIEAGWIERVEQSAGGAPAKPERVASADADATLSNAPAKPEHLASKPLPSRASARSRETEKRQSREETEGKGPAAPPAENRRRPFSDFFIARFEQIRGSRLVTDKSDFVALDALLKKTVDDPGFTLERLQARALQFLESTDQFHQKQGHPLRWFCQNINAFAGRNGKHNQSERERELQYIPVPEDE